MNVELNTELDIKKVHRLGKKRKVQIQPRLVIVRFASHRKTKNFMHKISKFKLHSNFTDVYLSEDLTPLQAKTLKYVKEVGRNKFVLFHNINEKIRMKQSAQELGTINNNEGDIGMRNWQTIDSFDDLYKHGINLDFDKLN